ncbi:MAG TPA: DNA polymerase III subunit beta [Bacteroidia bacterium]|nr:DNA polymerase III subunit beta [Bacteroidia bacterium]
MKFIVSSTLLLRHLQSVSGALNNNSPLPILENFLFEVAKGNLKISASDLETTMTTSMEVTSKEQGMVSVPARILLDTLKTFAEQPLTFTINDKNFQIEISSENGKFKLAGHDGVEFPKIPVVEQANSIEISAEVLLEAVNKTIFATGTDELRPVMSGVFFQLNKDNTTFVATDAHRLVRYRRNDIRSSKSTSFIVPRKPLTLLKSALMGLESKVKIEYNDANAFFSFDHFNLICRLIDGKYPNYEAVIPLDNPNRMVVSRDSFLNAIRRVSIFSNKTTHQVKLKIAGSELAISAEDIDFSNEANERLSCDYNGQDMEIAFNARFLSDMLSNLETENVTLELSLPNRAGIIRPTGNDENGEDILMLVMPVMIN